MASMHGSKRHPKLHKALAPSIHKHHKSHWPEWVISKTEMAKAMKAILARVHIVRSYDIPYLAGYSHDGHIIFIDRHMPKSFVYRKRRVNTDRFLVVHEAVEKALIHLLGVDYLVAHQIALHAEQAAVRAEGIEWDAYNDFMEKYIKMIGDEKLSKVPDNLDLTPYIDFHDTAELKQMRANTVPGPVLQPKHKVHIVGLQ
jgi:hypothetical protein